VRHDALWESGEGAAILCAEEEGAVTTEEHLERRRRNSFASASEIKIPRHLSAKTAREGAKIIVKVKAACPEQRDNPRTQLRLQLDHPGGGTPGLLQSPQRLTSDI
jgi:hypothetical protein